MLEFNSCRRDCELSGGFCAMAMAIVFRAAICPREICRPLARHSLDSAVRSAIAAERARTISCNATSSPGAGGRAQQSGVELVGLGELAESLGEQPRTQRIDDRNRVTRGVQGPARLTMVFGRRLR